MDRILIMGYIPTINGMSTSVLNVYRNLDRSRFQYDFLLCSEYRHLKTPDLNEILSMGGNLYYLDYDKKCLPESSYDELERIMLSIPDLKGVHVHDLYLMSYPLFLADRLGFPVKVIQCHSSWQSWGEDAPPSPKNDPDFATRRERISGNQYDRLACSDLVGKAAFGDLPYEFIPNGVDTRRFAFNPVHRTVLRRKLGIEDTTCVLGMVAGLFPSKNPLFALEVFHRYHDANPDSRYFILGKGTMEGEIREYVRQNNLSDCVHIFGAQKEIDVFYDAMDGIIFPSFSEGLPNSLVEAQVKGLPCLISDVITDMIKLTPLVNSFSLSEDADSWANELKRIVESKGTRRSYAEEIIAAGYEAKDVANKIMTLYSERIQSHQNTKS